MNSEAKRINKKDDRLLMRDYNYQPKNNQEDEDILSTSDIIFLCLTAFVALPLFSLMMAMWLTGGL